MRGISTVTQAIANGDMSRKIDVEAKGEILILKETINNMVDRLSIFCNEVQRVAKDVGVDGIMGGQADVAGLKGRWKEITTDVNTMANNLVRCIYYFYFYFRVLPWDSSRLTILFGRLLKYERSATSQTLQRTATLRSSLKLKLLARWMS